MVMLGSQLQKSLGEDDRKERIWALVFMMPLEVPGGTKGRRDGLVGSSVQQHCFGCLNKLGIVPFTTIIFGPIPWELFPSLQLSLGPYSIGFPSALKIMIIELCVCRGAGQQGSRLPEYKNSM